MNKKNLLCVVLAGTVFMSSNAVYADKLSSIGTSKDGEVMIIGSPYGNDKDDVVTDLTIEEAVNKAINYSRNIKNLDESNEIAEIDQMVTRYAWEQESNATANITYSLALKNLMNSLKNYNENKEAEKEKIEYNVKQLFYGLKDAERSIELYDDGIELSKRQLKIYDVMLKVGKMSQIQYNEAVTAAETLESNKLNLENSVDAAYRSLNQLMGESISKKYNIIVDDIEYKPVSSELNLDAAITKALSSNMTLRGLSDSVDIAKMSVDTFDFRDSTGVTSSDRESTRSQYEQASRGLEDAKKALTASVTSVYDNIRNTENEYRQNELSLNDMKNELVVKETQLKLGKLTQIELDQYKNSIDQLEAEMKSEVRSHDLLVMQFNNSNLIM